MSSFDTDALSPGTQHTITTAAASASQSFLSEDAFEQSMSEDPCEAGGHIIFQSRCFTCLSEKLSTSEDLSDEEISFSNTLMYRFMRGDIGTHGYQLLPQLCRQLCQRASRQLTSNPDEPRAAENWDWLQNLIVYFVTHAHAVADRVFEEAVEAQVDGKSLCSEGTASEEGNESTPVAEDSEDQLNIVDTDEDLQDDSPESTDEDITIEIEEPFPLPSLHEKLKDICVLINASGRILVDLILTVKDSSVLRETITFLDWVHEVARAKLLDFLPRVVILKIAPQSIGNLLSLFRHITILVSQQSLKSAGAASYFEAVFTDFSENLFRAGFIVWLFNNKMFPDTDELQDSRMVAALGDHNKSDDDDNFRYCIAYILAMLEKKYVKDVDVVILQNEYMGYLNADSFKKNSFYEVTAVLHEVPTRTKTRLLNPQSLVLAILYHAALSPIDKTYWSPTLTEAIRTDFLTYLGNLKSMPFYYPWSRANERNALANSVYPCLLQKHILLLVVEAATAETSDNEGLNLPYVKDVRPLVTPRVHFSSLIPWLVSKLKEKGFSQQLFTSYPPLIIFCGVNNYVKNAFGQQWLARYLDSVNWTSVNDRAKLGILIRDLSATEHGWAVLLELLGSSPLYAVDGHRQLSILITQTISACQDISGFGLELNQLLKDFLCNRNIFPDELVFRQLTFCYVKTVCNAQDARDRRIILSVIEKLSDIIVKFPEMDARNAVLFSSIASLVQIAELQPTTEFPSGLRSPLRTALFRNFSSLVPIANRILSKTESQSEKLFAATLYYVGTLIERFDPILVEIPFDTFEISADLFTRALLQQDVSVRLGLLNFLNSYFSLFRKKISEEQTGVLCGLTKIARFDTGSLGTQAYRCMMAMFGCFLSPAALQLYGDLALFTLNVMRRFLEFLKETNIEAFQHVLGSPFFLLVMEEVQKCNNEEISLAVSSFLCRWNLDELAAKKTSTICEQAGKHLEHFLRFRHKHGLSGLLFLDYLKQLKRWMNGQSPQIQAIVTGIFANFHDYFKQYRDYVQHSLIDESYQHFYQWFEGHYLYLCFNAPKTYNCDPQNRLLQFIDHLQILN